LAAAVIQNPFVDGRAVVAATLRSAGRARTAFLVLKGLRDEARPYWTVVERGLAVARRSARTASAGR
jgi:hypothetical protein